MPEPSHAELVEMLKSATDALTATSAAAHRAQDIAELMTTAVEEMAGKILVGRRVGRQELAEAVQATRTLRDSLIADRSTLATIDGLIAQWRTLTE